MKHKVALGLTMAVMLALCHPAMAAGKTETLVLPADNDGVPLHYSVFTPDGGEKGHCLWLSISRRPKACN